MNSKKIKDICKNPAIKFVGGLLLFASGFYLGQKVLNNHYDDILKKVQVFAFDCWEKEIDVKELFEILQYEPISEKSPIQVCIN